MDPKELAALADDIEKNGLRDAITLTAETPPRLVDGRNRVLACIEAGVEIPPDKIEILPEDVDPIAFSISRNDRRRNVTDEQRRAARAQLAALAAAQTEAGAGGDRRSENFKSAPTDLKTDRAAKALADDVSNIRAVQAHGTPEEIERVKTGKVSLRKTADAVRTRKAASREAASRETPAQKTPAKAPGNDQIDAVVTALLDSCGDGAIYTIAKTVKLIGRTRDEIEEALKRLGGAVKRIGSKFWFASDPADLRRTDGLTQDGRVDPRDKATAAVKEVHKIVGESAAPRTGGAVDPEAEIARLEKKCAAAYRTVEDRDREIARLEKELETRTKEFTVESEKAEKAAAKETARLKKELATANARITELEAKLRQFTN
jgi:hypothetical protein